MCDQVEAVYRAIEFIEAHLTTDITVTEIAGSAGYSLFHFMRTFNRLVHHTPYDYLIRRRLSESASELTTSKRKIIDIAQDFGFDNQEVYSRSFKRMFRVQPSQWRENQTVHSIMQMPAITFADLEYLNSERFSRPSLAELEETKWHGLMTVVEGDEKRLEKQQALLVDDLRSCLPGGLPEEIVTITTHLQGNKSRSYLFTGIREKEGKHVYSLLVSQRIPGGWYVKIQIKKEDKQAALNYCFFTWLPRTDFIPDGKMEIDISSKSDSSNVKTLFIPVLMDKP